MIHLAFFRAGRTTEWSPKERSNIWMDRRLPESIWRIEEATEEPVLMMPDQSQPFQIETDASKYATGAVLTQLDSNGDRHPVSFISKTFSPAKRNYEIYDRELLAIIRALEEWRYYIQGSLHTTIILSNHKNLTYYRLSWSQETKSMTSTMVVISFRIWC